MFGILSLLLSVISGAGCSQTVTPHASKAMNLDDAAVRLSQLSRRPIRPYATIDFGREKNVAARSVVVSDNDARIIVNEMRAQIRPRFLVYIGCTHSLARPPDTGSEVVVATGETQFDLSALPNRTRSTMGWIRNTLVEKLQAYDSKYGIDIFHAETDIIEFGFRNLPSDLTAFCEDLYEFCRTSLIKEPAPFKNWPRRLRTRRRLIGGIEFESWN